MLWRFTMLVILLFIYFWVGVYGGLKEQIISLATNNCWLFRPRPTTLLELKSRVRNQSDPLGIINWKNIQLFPNSYKTNCSAVQFILPIWDVDGHQTRPDTGHGNFWIPSCWAWCCCNGWQYSTVWCVRSSTGACHPSAGELLIKRITD